MKKNILSLIAFISLGLAANAQSFEIYEGITSTTDISGTTVYANLTNDEYEGHFYVKNISGAPINTQIRRVNINATTPAVTYGVCWGATSTNNPVVGICYPPENSQSFTTPSGATLDGSNVGYMVADVQFDNVNEPVHVRYYVEDINGVKYDSLDLVITTTLSTKEIKNTASINAYPNPANDVINLAVQGSTDNSMKMIDVLGNVIVEEKFGTSKKLDVSQFKNGVYILTVYSNGKLVQTKRVVVRH